MLYTYLNMHNISYFERSIRSHSVKVWRKSEDNNNKKENEIFTNVFTISLNRIQKVLAVIPIFTSMLLQRCNTCLLTIYYP